MTEYFELDFLPVGTKTSGDAIAIRYKVGEEVFIHVVDGGYQTTGDSVVSHINEHYEKPAFINHVVATHPDGDHLGGLRSVLEKFSIGTLWMLRPWDYADELLPRFSRFKNVENLRERLRELYPNVAALEDIANEREIEIRAPVQGSQIGKFWVLAPSPQRYLDLVVESDRTPEAAKKAEENRYLEMGEVMLKSLGKWLENVKADWGIESFSKDETSAENEMSVVQYALLCDEKIVLTADTGRKGLMEAAQFAPNVNLNLPGVDRFQVPHHGSRRNVSTEALDIWLGKRVAEGTDPTFTAIVSAGEKDENHPRNSVSRAMIHRGAKLIVTNGVSKQLKRNAPDRAGWTPARYEDYPATQEE